MKARELQKYLDTDRTVHLKNKTICISSAMIPDLLMVHTDKNPMLLVYRLDTFGEGYNSLKSKDLQYIWKKLEHLIDTNGIDYYMQGNDQIENPLPVYWFDYETEEVKESTTDKYGHPNITAEGYLMYDNTHFKTKIEALEYGIKEMQYDLKFAREKHENYKKEQEELMNKIYGCEEKISILKDKLESLKNQ